MRWSRRVTDVICSCTRCTAKAGFDRGDARWKRYHSASHTSTLELARIAEKARPKLLVLYHVLFLGCSGEKLLREVHGKYRGPVVLGQDLAVY